MVITFTKVCKYRRKQNLTAIISLGEAIKVSNYSKIISLCLYYYSMKKGILYPFRETTLLVSASVLAVYFFWYLMVVFITIVYAELFIL